MSVLTEEHPFKHGPQYAKFAALMSRLQGLACVWPAPSHTGHGGCDVHRVVLTGRKPLACSHLFKQIISIYYSQL